MGSQTTGLTVPVLSGPLILLLSEQHTDPRVVRLLSCLTSFLLFFLRLIAHAVAEAS